MIKSFFYRLLRWWKGEKPQKNEFNYLYFTFLLLFLFLLSLSHFLLIERPFFGLPLLFLIYSLGQSLLEISLFILLAFILVRWAPKWVFFLFISLSFVLQLVHFTDFVLVRLTDTSFSHMFKFFFCSGIRHILTSFQALNLNGLMLLIIILSFPTLSLIGLFFYWLTHLLSRKKPFFLSLSQLSTAILSIGITLFLLDLAIHPFLNQLEYRRLQKTLPFGTTFIPPTPRCIQLKQEIAPARIEKETLPSFSLSSRPNLYLFVIETLRSDYIQDPIAPALTSFGRENIHFAHSYANSNSTMTSWFAIFHSDFPYQWTQMRDEWKEGSVPLRILKNLGYKIHIYSSANLSYFQIDKLLFGNKRQLIDHLEDYSSFAIEPCERDALAFKSFERNMSNDGNVYIFFLDSTHSEYSFPKDFPLLFQPISQEIDYFAMGPKSKELEYVKNRYRNSIHYIDQLMGQFFSLLKEKGLYENAMIAITGDHGEEFFEEGAIFHGSHLNDYQLKVPLFLKLPGCTMKSTAEEATHMDLFPSILHYLTRNEDFSSLFDGQSAFSTKRWPYRIAVQQNGPQAPCEFLIQSGKKKLVARFPHSKKKLDLEIIDIQVPDSSSELSLKQRIDSAFPNAIEFLFQ